MNMLIRLNKEQMCSKCQKSIKGFAMYISGAFRHVNCNPRTWKPNNKRAFGFARRAMKKQLGVPSAKDIARGGRI